MRGLVYRAQARRDIGHVANWLRSQGVSADTTRRFVATIYGACQRIAENPAEVGTLREDLGLPLRSFPFRDYLIFFRYRSDAVEIVRVIHGARDLASLFEKR